MKYDYFHIHIWDFAFELAYDASTIGVSSGFGAELVCLASVVLAVFVFVCLACVTAYGNILGWLLKWDQISGSASTTETHKTHHISDVIEGENGIIEKRIRCSAVNHSSILEIEAFVGACWDWSGDWRWAWLLMKWCCDFGRAGVGIGCGCGHRGGSGWMEGWGEGGSGGWASKQGGKVVLKDEFGEDKLGVENGMDWHEREEVISGIPTWMLEIKRKVQNCQWSTSGLKYDQDTL